MNTQQASGLGLLAAFVLIIVIAAVFVTGLGMAVLG